MASRDRARPALKWPGGKYRLLGEILPRLPEGSRLVEPFTGSGVVFLNSDYPSCLLCDVNADLILYYKTLAREKERFIDRCRALFDGGNAAAAFYERRDRFNAGAKGPERAALFLYLNRHGYNGLVRYNKRGLFNVPFGRYAKPHFPDGEMRFFLSRLAGRRVAFRACDFRETFSLVRGGDVVYCDPPYIPLSETANFTAYAGHAFGGDEQMELARLAEEASARGVRVVVSNHAGKAARTLYKGAKRIREFSVRRSIGCAGRAMVGELLAEY